jgi:hypothetical protein
MKLRGREEKKLHINSCSFGLEEIGILKNLHKLSYNHSCLIFCKLTRTQPNASIYYRLYQFQVGVQIRVIVAPIVKAFRFTIYLFIYLSFIYCSLREINSNNTYHLCLLY